MTVERPINLAHVWLVNATEEPIDVHINYSDQPAITDLKGLAVGTEFQVKGKDDTPYGTYTFSARHKDRRSAGVLAAASIAFWEGRSLSAVFHQLPDGKYRFSVYENDFTPSDAPRMTVRHTARPDVLTWRIAPKEFKIEIPPDERQGTLRNGEWQVATNVVQNDYRLEVLLDGQLVAEHPDLELEHEKDRTMYIVGDPYPTADTGTLRRFVITQEFKLPRGAPPPVAVTDPDEPHSTGDHNRLIEFSCPRLEVVQTNTGSALVSAVDPDGVVTDLALASVHPEAGGIFIPDHGVAPATAIGGRATATVRVLGDVPPGNYQALVVANANSLGERAACTLRIEVAPVTLERVSVLALQYEQSGAIDTNVYEVLARALRQADQSLTAGDVERACAHLKDAAALVASEKDEGIEVRAAEHLERELKALRDNLLCG